MGRLADPRARRVHRVLAAPDGACISGAAIALRLRSIGESLALSAVALQNGHPIVAGSTSPAHDREMICRGSARINGRKRSQTDHDPRSKSLPALEKRTPPHFRACEQRHGRRHRLSDLSTAIEAASHMSRSRQVQEDSSACWFFCPSAFYKV